MAKTLLIAAPVVALMLLLPQVTNRGVTFIAAVTYLYIVFGFSWNLMFGYTGMASFGHGAFFAVGAYFYSVVAQRAPGFDFLLLLLGTGVFTFIVAVVVGMVVVRRSHGVYFAVLTIALGQVVYLLVTETPALGRDDGFTGITRPVIGYGPLAVDLARGDNYYYFVVVSSLLLTAATWWLVHGKLGRRFKAIQQDPDRAAFFGIDVFRNKLLSFSLAAAIAGVVGAIYAPLLQIVTPAVAFFAFSAQPVLYTMLGGMGSFWGPAIGGLIFASLDYSTRSLVGVSELLVGTTLLMVVLALPAGIVGLISTARTLSMRMSAGAGDRR